MNRSRVFGLFQSALPRLAAFGLLICFGTASANDYLARLDNSNSIEWQKVDLEEKLIQKIDRAISPVVPARHYVVSVKIALKPPASRKEQIEKKLKQGTGDAGNIPLSKLELDAPLIGEEDPFEEQSPVESLFERIGSIDVLVLLDKSVSQEKSAVVNRVTQETADAIAPGVVKVKIEQAEVFSPINPPETEKAKVEEPWSLRKWLLELKIPIALLSGVFLICACLFGVFMLTVRSYRGLENRKIGLMEAQFAAAQAEADKREAEKLAQQESLTTQTGPEDQTPVEGVVGGFQKFQSYVARSPEGAAELIKQWLRLQSAGAEAALAALPQFLSTEELLSMFPFLSAADRKLWKKSLTAGVTASSRKLGETFVSTQLVDSLLIPMPSIDAQAREAIMGLSPAEAVEIARSDSDAGALLMSLLPATQASKMYSLLPQDLASSLTSATLRLSEEDLRTKAPSLLSPIQSLKASKKAAASPFVEKAEALLRDSTPEKESLIFDGLVQSGDFETLTDVAQRNFPAELVSKLPPNVIKASLERMPKARRLDFLSAIDAAEQQTFLDAMGKPGSKLREMLDVDLSTVTADALRVERAKKALPDLRRDLVDSVRAIIVGNPTVRDAANQVLTTWLSAKNGGQPVPGQGGSNEKLAA